MILIADSGSTKTHWALVATPPTATTTSADYPIMAAANEPATHATPILRTGGVNPNMQTHDEICAIMQSSELKQALATTIVEAIRFYGAGCSGGTCSQRVEQALKQVFCQCHDIAVASDMLGAARALCQNASGVVCILGTGSNSCLYDGEKIVMNTPPLGFILGDEGSGAHLGRLLIGNILKNQFPKEIRDSFFEQSGLEYADIIEQVYRKPFPNRWLASLSPFIHRHLYMPPIKEMVIQAFRDFLQRNVHNYNRPDLPISCTGSIAYHYQELLREAAHSMNLEIGHIIQNPINGLIAYHHANPRH